MKQFIIIILVSLLFASCKKFLDAKPDKSVAVPSTLQDMQALLDNSFIMNTNYPALAEIAADDYYVSSTDWTAISNVNDRQNYIWAPDAEIPNNWINPYRVILYANTVLDNISTISITNSNVSQINNCKGQAYFHRAFSHFGIAQVYCRPWGSGDQNEGPGIPLKLIASIDEPVKRVSIRQSYDQVITDLRLAIQLLPVDNTVKARPNKVAGYGLMARIYLAMEEYSLAGLYADSCLQLYNQLIDYNTISPSASISFPVFNNEVIFHCSNNGSSILGSQTWRADTSLVASYHDNDLRKIIFFSKSSNGSYAFKGNYTGSFAQAFFTGVAVNEVMLIKAECLARKGDFTGAMQVLNSLLIKRWKSGTFVPFTASDGEQALRIVLSERRKELVFRGLRWQDLRRLNKDARFKVTLSRSINGKVYELPPGDLRYVMLIPYEVISFSGIEQNPR